MNSIIKTLTLTLSVLACMPAFGMFRNFSRPFMRASFRLPSLLAKRPMTVTAEHNPAPFNPRNPRSWAPYARLTKRFEQQTEEMARLNTAHTQAKKQVRFWKGLSFGALAGFGAASYAAVCFANECDHLENTCENLEERIGEGFSLKRKPAAQRKGTIS